MLIFACDPDVTTNSRLQGYHLDGNLDTTKSHASATVGGGPGRRGESGQDMRTTAGVRNEKGGKKKKLKDTGSQTGLYFASSKALDIEKMRLETAVEGKKPERSICEGCPALCHWRDSAATFHLDSVANHRRP